MLYMSSFIMVATNGNLLLHMGGVGSQLTVRAPVGVQVVLGSAVFISNPALHTWVALAPT